MKKSTKRFVFGLTALAALSIALPTLTSCEGSSDPSISSIEEGISVSITGDDTVIAGQSIVLVANVSGTTNTAVTWLSLNTGVATVTNGIVTGVSAGTTTIYAISAADSSKMATKTITVLPGESVKNITVSISGPTTVKAGETITLSATVSGYESTGAVIWASDDTEIATVSAGGVVTGIASGIVTIRALSLEDTSKSATVQITVTPAEDPSETEYAINVDLTPADSVDYTLSTTKAKAGDAVSLTATAKAGYTITSVKMNGTALTGSGNVYSFTMPDRSATIAIQCSVEGDVVLTGGVVAAFTLNQATGIYEAKNVKVESASDDVLFNVLVNGQGGTASVLSFNALDETKCFADMTFGSGTYKYSIASGSTYDFYYNPNAKYGFYVVRTKVDVLPSTASRLWSLVEGRPYSETSVHTPNLNGITYQLTTSSLDSVEGTKGDGYAWSWDLYEDNLSFAKNSNGDFTYKHADLTNGVYEIANTHTKNEGNDDPYLTFPSHDYAERFDIVEDSTEDMYRDNPRFDYSKRYALRDVNYPAHSPYELERDYMYAYRVGFTSGDVSSSNISIVPTSVDGGFDVKIDSYAEYGSSEDSSEQPLYESYVFDATVSFNENGSYKSVTYTKKLFTKTQWDWSAHAPKAGMSGIVVRTLNAAYTYGDPKSGTPEDFNASDYFISSFDSLYFHNTKSGQDEVAGVSNVCYNDELKIFNNDDDFTYNKNAKYTFTPSTALDLWQYHPVASDNEEAVAHTATDTWEHMTVLAASGTCNVVFGNGTSNSGATKNVALNIYSTAKFHTLSLMSVSQYLPDNTYSLADLPASATQFAGTVCKYMVTATPSDAPVIFDATPSDARFKIIKTGKDFIVDTNDFEGITEAVTVTIYLNSEQYQDWLREESKIKIAKVGGEYIEYVATWTFTVAPSSKIGGYDDIYGDWVVNYAGGDTTTVTFTDEAYEGTYSSYYFSAPKKGIVTDVYTDNKGTHTDVWYFYYEIIEGAYVNAKVYDWEITSFSDSGLDFDIAFYYKADSSQFAFALWASEYDSDYEEYFYYDVIGNVNDDGSIANYVEIAKED